MQEVSRLSHYIFTMLYLSSPTSYTVPDREYDSTASPCQHLLKRKLNFEVYLSAARPTVCKIKKCGTLLYRCNGDTLVALTNALYKMSRLTNVTSTHGNEGEGKCEAQNTVDSMQLL